MTMFHRLIQTGTGSNYIAVQRDLGSDLVWVTSSSSENYHMFGLPKDAAEQVAFLMLSAAKAREPQGAEDDQ